MDTNKTETNTTRSRESDHDMRGKLLHRSQCDGHLLVLCIVPYEQCVGWVEVSMRLTVGGYRVHAFDVKSGVWIVERDVYLNSLALAHLTEWGATTLQPRWGCGVFPAMSQGSSFLATLG